MAQRLTDLAPGTPTLASLIWFADMTQPAGSRDRVATLQVIAAALGVAIGYVAATDPGVDDDETEGYGQLSLGLNTATEALFICVDPTEGAAVWIPLAGGAGSALATIRSYSANHELDPSDDLGAYIRITDEADINLPNGLPTGYQALIVNATDSDTVTITATGTLVIPSGFEPEIQNRRAVTVVHVGSNVWEAHGALVETP